MTDASPAVTSSATDSYRTPLMDAATLDVHVLQIPSTGNRSYVLSSEGLAIAVDVPRDIDAVEQLLDHAGLTLCVVLETHLHNDYLTGGLSLAARRGAAYVVPAGPTVQYSAIRVEDGDELGYADLRIVTIATPGHTDAHAAYAVIPPGAQQAAALLTGGSLLYGTTGRTDLLGRERAEELARAQYWSARRLPRLVPGTARLLPTHGFGGFCAAGTGLSTPESTPFLLSDELERNPAFALTEEAFVTDLLGRLDDYPSHYARMGDLNRLGPTMADLSVGDPAAPGDVASRRDRGEAVVDLRPRADFAAEHLAGSINIEADGPVAAYVGWLVPRDHPVTLIGNEDELRDAVRALARIGVDRPGCTGDDLAALTSAGGGRAFPRRRFADLVRAPGADVGVVVDARSDLEWRSGHVAGAWHVPVHRARALPQTPEPAWVYCRTGFRAAVLASLLETQGRSVVLVDDDLEAAAASGLPWCHGVGCDDRRCLTVAAA
jgi:hydroxyacylglutathione hydrolase